MTQEEFIKSYEELEAERKMIVEKLSSLKQEGAMQLTPLPIGTMLRDSHGKLFRITRSRVYDVRNNKIEFRHYANPVKKDGTASVVERELWGFEKYEVVQ